MKYLNDINTPVDLKKLSIEQLDDVAVDIREFLIKSISETGGHLASNLGVVELSIAINYVYDFSKDKIIWDVGHQAYTHKILTNRKKLFETLRKKGGLSGFPKCSESEYDHFNTGHSSTALSASVGFLAGRDLAQKDFNIVSVVGDGAMTGGLIYEALNNIKTDAKNFVVILNDNQMSISENVGSMSKHLNALRFTKSYINTKGEVKQLLSKFDNIGSAINKVLEKTRDGLKYTLMENAVFEKLGMKYVGPIDGHNIASIIDALKKIKNSDKPVILHTVTKKGKGYEPAEKEPLKYHATGKFDIATGTLEAKSKEYTFSQIFGRFMAKEANKNKKIVAVTASMPAGTGLLFFKRAYPDRFFDTGIAEAHSVVFSAGLAKMGFIPVFAVYSSFLQRAYDQIIHDVCIQNLHVVFAIDRAGVVGEDGETHQGVFDISYLSHIPNLTIMAPKDKEEFEDMLDFAINRQKGPIAIRYPKGLAGTNDKIIRPIEFGRSELVAKGKKILIVSVGTMFDSALYAYKHLKRQGYGLAFINARFISPICPKLIDSIKLKYDYIFTIEDNLISGGFGEKLNSILIRNKIFDKKIFNMGFPDEYIEHASIKEIFTSYGLDGESVYKYILNEIKDDESLLPKIRKEEVKEEIKEVKQDIKQEIEVKQDTKEVKKVTEVKEIEERKEDE